MTEKQDIQLQLVEVDEKPQPVKLSKEVQYEGLYLQKELEALDLQLALLQRDIESRKADVLSKLRIWKAGLPANPDKYNILLEKGVMIPRGN